MLHQHTKEEKQLWETLGSAGHIWSVAQPTGVAEEIRLVDSVLKREFRRLTWWRPLVGALCLFCIVVLASFNIETLITRGFRLDRLLQFFRDSIFAGVCTYMLTRMKPTTRWINGVTVLLELAKHAPAEESVRPLLYVAEIDSKRIPLHKHALSLVLYQRLSDVLYGLTDFVPDATERKFLQHIVLSHIAYPGHLRIAALLILGDHPEQLSPKFRTKLTFLSNRGQSDVFQAAVRDVLSR